MKMNFRFALPLVFSLATSFSLSANAQSQGVDHAAIIACINSVRTQAEELKKQAEVVCADETTSTECLAIKEQLVALREKFRACVPNAGSLPKVPKLPKDTSTSSMPQLPTGSSSSSMSQSSDSASASSSSQTPTNGGSVPSMPQFPDAGSLPVPVIPQLPDGSSLPSL